MIYHTIAVAYDNSELAAAALREAVRLAATDDRIELRIVQVVDLAEELELQLAAHHPDMTIEESGDERLRPLREEAIRKIDAELHRHIDTQLAGVRNKTFIDLIAGDLPSDQIVEYAQSRECDLIVMGCRGLGAFRGMLGSVSAGVLRNAAMPILIVK